MWALDGIFQLDNLNVISMNQEKPAKKSKGTKVVVVDVEDVGAMAKWTRGMCRGQTVQHLALVFETDATVTAIAKEMSEGFPKQAQKIVKQVCEAELRKTKPSTEADPAP